MNDELDPNLPLLTRVGWFFWRNWNRAVCAIRGCAPDEVGFCRRCGLPVGPFPPITTMDELRRFDELGPQLVDWDGAGACGAHPGCPYLAPPGSVCNKCGTVVASERIDR